MPICNLVSKTEDPGSLNQTTSYHYDTTNHLSAMDQPDGTTVTFAYDADGHRVKKTVTTGGTTTQIKDTYQGGRLAYETDGANTLLATFTYDADGRPSSVQVGSDPSTVPRYYYVYNGHGDTVALVDASGTAVAIYAYDEQSGGFGVLATNAERFALACHPEARGRPGTRYDDFSLPRASLLRQPLRQPRRFLAHHGEQRLPRNPDFIRPRGHRRTPADGRQGTPKPQVAGSIPVPPAQT